MTLQISGKINPMAEIAPEIIEAIRDITYPNSGTFGESGKSCFMGQLSQAIKLEWWLWFPGILLAPSLLLCPAVGWCSVGEFVCERKRNLIILTNFHSECPLLCYVCCRNAEELG